MARVLRDSKANVATAYSRRHGTLYVGDSMAALGVRPLRNHLGKVQMVFTSPPFPLNRKKKYGNLQGDEYVEWLASYAPVLVDYLTPDGSIVIEVGNGWDQGQPTVSTLAIEALLAFKKHANLHLCQEFICFNPARLPSPAQWVTVERCRVKDAFTRVWWMSPTPRPKADNSKILTEYSGAMRRLLERGTYNSGRRPSEHNIGQQSFLANNGGAIPPNVLLPSAAELAAELVSGFSDTFDVLPIANTSTSDPYQRHCRENGIPQHPARMPIRLVEFFVEFLTDPGDLVLDPFAGTNTTGFVCEYRNREWISIEADPHYAELSEIQVEHSDALRSQSVRRRNCAIGTRQLPISKESGPKTAHRVDETTRRVDETPRCVDGKVRRMDGTLGYVDGTTRRRASGWLARHTIRCAAA